MLDPTHDFSSDAAAAFGLGLSMENSTHGNKG
jgi:hypothetical protein